MAPFEAEMPPEHAECLLQWSEALYEAFRCRRMAADLARTLTRLGLGKAAARAVEASNHIEEELVTGDMLEQLRRRFELKHPVVSDPVCSALIVQFTGVKVRELFASVDEERIDYLGEMAEQYIEAARKALVRSKQEELV